MIPRTAVGKYSVTLPVAGAQIRLQFPHTLSCAVLFVPLWCEASHQGWSACLRLLFFSLSLFLRVLWREAAVSYACVCLTMVPLVVFATVLSTTVVTTETVEDPEGKAPALPPDYSGISLPPEHIPYFLNNNKKVAKQCCSDPRCPFKVSYVFWQVSTSQMIILVQSLRL